MTHCRVSTHDPEAGAADGPASVCEHCAAEGAKAVKDLVSAWLRLSDALPKDYGTSSDDPVTRAAMGSAPPMKVHVFDLARRIEQSIADWENWFRGERGFSTRPRRENHVRDGAEALRTAWSEVVQTRSAVRLIDQAVRLRDQAHAVLKLTALSHHSALPCPRCDVRDVWRPNGEDWHRCGSCGLFLSARDYKIAVDLALEAHGCHR